VSTRSTENHLDERGAFRSLIEHLSLAQEAAVMVGVNLGNAQWAVIAEHLANTKRLVEAVRANRVGAGDFLR